MYKEAAIGAGFFCALCNILTAAAEIRINPNANVSDDLIRILMSIIAAALLYKPFKQFDNNQVQMTEETCARLVIGGFLLWQTYAGTIGNLEQLEASMPSRLGKQG